MAIPDRVASLVVDGGEERPFIQRALELGINFFDTANMYSEGDERGSFRSCDSGFCQTRGIRHCDQGLFSDAKGCNSEGLSRKAIMAEIDQSLKRLDMDYVDLYQIHRWDNRHLLKKRLKLYTMS